MAKITLEYNARNSVANKIIEIILAMDNVFKVKVDEQPSNINVTRRAIYDVEQGNMVVCDSYEEYLRHTSKLAEA